MRSRPDELSTQPIFPPCYCLLVAPPPTPNIQRHSFDEIREALDAKEDALVAEIEAYAESQQEALDDFIRATANEAEALDIASEECVFGGCPWLAYYYRCGGLLLWVVAVDDDVWGVILGSHLSIEPLISRTACRRYRLRLSDDTDPAGLLNFYAGGSWVFVAQRRLQSRVCASTHPPAHPLISQSISRTSTRARARPHSDSKREILELVQARDNPSTVDALYRLAGRKVFLDIDAAKAHIAAMKGLHILVAELQAEEVDASGAAADDGGSRGGNRGRTGGRNGDS